MIRDLIDDYEKNFNNFKKNLIKRIEILESENKVLKKENNELQNKYNNLYIEFNNYKETYNEKCKYESSNYAINIKESLSKLNEIIEVEKDKFVNLSSATIKRLINSNTENKYKIEFKEILKYSEAIEWLDIKEINTILLISVFYNIYDEFNKYVINDNSIESKFIKMLEVESSLSNDDIIEEPIHNFLMENEDLLKEFDIRVLDRIKVFINILLYKVVKKVNICEHQKVNCTDDSGQLVIKPIFIKIKDKNSKIKYILKELNVCSKCNSAYILRKNLNNQSNYKILINEINSSEGGISSTNIIKGNDKVVNSLSNNIKQDKEDIELKNLYNKLIINYKKNDNNALRKNVNSIILNKKIVNKLTKTEFVTVIICGYISNVNRMKLLRAISTFGLKVGVDNIFLNKLIYEKDHMEYWKNNYDNINIDSDIKDTIFKRINKVNNFILNSNKIISKEDYVYLKDFDGRDLKQESELKKLGYSSTISRSERENILKNKAIPKLGKARVRSHIEWLINMNKNKSTMKNSVIEWSYDLDRLSRM